MKINYSNVSAVMLMVSLIKIRFKTEAPHTDKGWHQFNMDVASLLLAVFVLLFSNVSQASAILPDNVRKVVLDKHLSHLKSYEKCLVETAKQTNLPEMLLLSILLQENGRTGQYSVNRNRTKDYGLGQINDVRADEIARIGLTISDILHDGCKNIVAVAYLLTNEFAKSNGEFWTAIGNYHYSKHGPYPRHHYAYIRNVHKKWSILYETVKQASVER